MNEGLPELQVATPESTDTQTTGDLNQTAPLTITQPVLEPTMQEILEKQGVVFYPRLRKAAIPGISGIKLGEKMDEISVEKILKSVSFLTDYLETPALGDS